MLGCDPVRRQDEETLGGGREPSCACVRGRQQCSLPGGKAGEPGAGVLLGPSGQSEGDRGLGPATVQRGGRSCLSRAWGHWQDSDAHPLGVGVAEGLCSGSDVI